MYQPRPFLTLELCLYAGLPSTGPCWKSRIGSWWATVVLSYPPWALRGSKCWSRRNRTATTWPKCSTYRTRKFLRKNYQVGGIPIVYHYPSGCAVVSQRVCCVLTFRLCTWSYRVKKIARRRPAAGLIVVQRVSVGNQIRNSEDGWLPTCHRTELGTTGRRSRVDVVAVVTAASWTNRSCKFLSCCTSLPHKLIHANKFEYRCYVGTKCVRSLLRR